MNNDYLHSWCYTRTLHTDRPGFDEETREAIHRINNLMTQRNHKGAGYRMERTGDRDE